MEASWQTSVSCERVLLIPVCLLAFLMHCINTADTVTGSKQNLGKGFSFKTCGNTGHHGPTQYQCDAAYRITDQAVHVLSTPAGFSGVQVWTVPNTTLYSITALGASGGKGVRNTEVSMGSYAHAKFNLTKGEKIYMLIGQQGDSACSQTNKKNDATANICHHGVTPGDDGARKLGGGGGGGGGTFVFKIDNVTGEVIPLIVAGGGGGKSFQLGKDPIKADGGISNMGTGFSALTDANSPGGGGGWDGYSNYSQAGRSLLQGGSQGGTTCPLAHNLYGWEINGGFGGGGGACTAGGGGGGYTGGNISQQDQPEHNGQGGSSYINPEGLQPRYEAGTQNGDGEVEIAHVLDCPCEYMCIYHNYKKRQFKCYCQPNYILAEDGNSCVDARDIKSPEPELPLGAIVAAVLGGIVALVAVIAVLLCLVHQHRKRHRGDSVRLDTLSPDHQLDRLRFAGGGTLGGVTEYNPNYDFGGAKYTVEDLREIPREYLTLIRALGQGAFGEVYQGYLFLPSTPAGSDAPHLPVAVKTLPALCTDQAEMDFLMEALIMSKFNHPNIVQFYGVCFEKHPRFIVLELLEGGDLKAFLREARPKAGEVSVIRMTDLVRLSLDIAKGCKYLEDNHFIHRDIAARNCLLTSKAAADRVAKIADFGMARDIYRADYYRKGGKAMLPVKWMPPEAFLDGIFTSKTDVWSFGILLWEVFSLGYMPYPGRGNQEVMQLVTSGGRLDPPHNCPAPINHIMNLCWTRVSEHRPHFQTIIDKLELALENWKQQNLYLVETAQCEGMVEVEAARYEQTLPTPSPSIRPVKTAGTQREPEIRNAILCDSCTGVADDHNVPMRPPSSTNMVLTVDMPPDTSSASSPKDRAAANGGPSNASVELSKVFTLDSEGGRDEEGTAADGGRHATESTSLLTDHLTPVTTMLPCTSSSTTSPCTATAGSSSSNGVNGTTPPILYQNAMLVPRIKLNGHAQSPSDTDEHDTWL